MQPRLNAHSSTILTQALKGTITSSHWPPHLSIGVEELAPLAAHDGERIPPVSALDVGVELVLGQRNACRGIGGHRGRRRRSRNHGQALGASDRGREQRERENERLHA